MTRNWLRTLFARPAVRTAHRPRTRLGLEALEDRTVPAAFTVANGLDSGTGSLRAAVALANANPDADTITFAPGVTAVTLTTGQLTLSTNMTIAGPVNGSVTVARSSAVGTPDFRIFAVAPGAMVQLANLTITGGRTSISDAGGGGIYNNNGILTVTASIIAGNTAAPGSGGGIYNKGALTVTASTISGNTAPGSGGGIYNAQSFASFTVTASTLSGNTADLGGAIFIDEGTGTVVASTLSGNSADTQGGGILIGGGTLTVTSSTLSGNSAGTVGGGIANGSGALTVTSSTLSGNSADTEGGGIANGSGALTVTSSTLSGNSAGTLGGGIRMNVGTASLTNTIVANSSSGGDLAVALGGSFSGSNNLIEDGSGGASLGKISGDPNLGLLAANGGPTLTHALLGGSIAIDAGGWLPGVIEDQRSFPRPVGAFDIGAVESGGTSQSLVVTRPDDVSADDGLITLREAVALANQNQDAHAITFAPGITAVTLTQGTLELSSIVTIAGPAGATVTVGRAATAPAFAIFTVGFTGTAELKNLTITGGAGGIVNFGAVRVTASTIAGNTGSGIANFAHLVVDSSTVSGNTGANVGGGLLNGDGGATTATILSSTFSGNSANLVGGAIASDGFARLTVWSSTFSGNTAPEGGGISAAGAYLFNTIVANSSGGDLGGGPFYGTGNLIEDGGGAPTLVKISGDPNLGPLANNGGPTKTHALLPGSIAIDAGSNALAAGWTTDQRGLPRFVGTVDIGAFEHQGGIAFLQADPLNPGQKALVVLGTAGADVIAVDRSGTNRYTVGIASLASGECRPTVWTGTFSGPISRVVVYGGEGNDGIAVDNNLAVNAWLYGQGGNDTMIGGGGNDVMLGGAGKDKLTARGGRDIVIGGSGADALYGGSGGDLLIAGTTAFDLDEATLRSIQQEWTSSRDAPTRVANLRGTGTGPRANGSTFLKASGTGATVFSDSDKDTLTGGSGRDWFFANRSGAGVLDTVSSLQSSDFTDEL